MGRGGAGPLFCFWDCWALSWRRALPHVLPVPEGRTLVPSGQCTLCARLETLFYRSLSLRADSAPYLFLCRLLDGLDFLHASSFEYEQSGAKGFDRDFVFPPGRD